VGFTRAFAGKDSVPGVPRPTPHASSRGPSPQHSGRKPGPGGSLRADRKIGLDLAASWMLGDKVADVLAAVNAECLGTILVRIGRRASDERAYSGFVRLVIASLVVGDCRCALS
jgi:histidinol phosphatase-like enzyme